VATGQPTFVVGFHLSVKRGGLHFPSIVRVRRLAGSACRCSSSTWPRRVVAALLDVLAKLMNEVVVGDPLEDTTLVAWQPEHNLSMGLNPGPQPFV
jgi:hypothetical protein